eukprot:2529807-Pyramimonas_sp.AAC.1
MPPWAVAARGPAVLPVLCRAGSERKNKQHDRPTNPEKNTCRNVRHGNASKTHDWATGKYNAECIDLDVLCRGLCCATPC